jgi:nicotinate phosphoribosyltransferase
MSLNARYATNLTLLTDLYQLTMAYGYWKTGRADTQAVFTLSFRKNPFQGGYTVACGLSDAVDYLQNFHFEPGDLDYLGSLPAADGTPLFSADFLQHLRTLRFTCDVDAVPEGTVVFPCEPLVRVQGPIIQAQIVETALLNHINFGSLIATKAARMRDAVGNDLLVEYGLRRAQGPDGALSAARAAYIGGCDATSNVLAGKLFGIPLRGTHAHSWVMSFDTELAAFEAYASAMPANCLLLVDTYDTLDGVRHAVTVARQLRDRGYKFGGIRLDSGDLAYLSIEARKILDEAGFADAMIFASNDLDEELIESLKHQGTRINGWGVGTKLVTGYDQPALGGVYKLSALREPAGAWQNKLKLSEQTSKTSIPGITQVRRYNGPQHFIADAIYQLGYEPSAGQRIVDPIDASRFREVPCGCEHDDLLVPIFRAGELVASPPAIAAIRDHARDQLSMLHPAIRRFKNPHRYPAGLEESLHAERTAMIAQLRVS